MTQIPVRGLINELAGQDKLMVGIYTPPAAILAGCMRCRNTRFGRDINSTHL